MEYTDGTNCHWTGKQFLSSQLLKQKLGTFALLREYKMTGF